MVTPKFSIIQISDLHKDSDFNYNQLIDSLKSDTANYVNLGIYHVRYIVVCGDLIQGTRNTDIAKGNQDIQRQYEEVSVFLHNLVDVFLNGDISRLIIVPGNHDVNRAVSSNSMKRIEASEQEKVQKSYWERYGKKQIYRFDWKTLSFMQIIDEKFYSSRFDSFVTFYNRFYSSIGRTFPVSPEEDASLIAFSNDKIAFACFNSCCQLDHLNAMGTINENAFHCIYGDLSSCYSNGYLMFGVWHHHIYGVPHRCDFMDMKITKSMACNHILVGLFGHQHRSEVVEELNDLAEDIERDKMHLISSGTLFGSRKEMLPGVKRQYNLINVEIENGSANLEVFGREDKMNDAPYPIWGEKYLLKGKKSLVFQVPLNKLSDDDLLRIIDEETRESGDFKNGILRMKQLDNPVKQGFIDEYIQQLSLEVEDLNFILNVFKQPLSNMEYCYLMQASILNNNVDDVRKLIGMTPYKDSDDILVTSQIAEGVKFVRKNKKTWEK